MPPGFDPGAARLVAQCLNHCATSDPYYYYIINKLCFRLVIETSLHYDARSEKHQISFVRSVRPPVHLEQLGSYSTDFHEN